MSQPLKTALLIVILSGLCLPARGMAQDAKIAVVDVQALTLASDEGKAAGDKLDKRIQAITAEVDKVRKDIENKETDLRTRERVMSATAKAQLQREIDDAKRTFDRKNQDYQKELNDMQNDLLEPVARKAQEILAAFVNENGYTLLIDLSAMNTNVVWFNPANDITARVMKNINDAYKKSAGASGTTPATTTPAASAPKPPATTPAAPPARSTTPANAPSTTPRSTTPGTPPATTPRD